MFLGMGPGELALIGILAVLLFGKRLPLVARSWGQSYQQFRAGLGELQSEFNRVRRDVENEIVDRPAIGYGKSAPSTMELETAFPESAATPLEATCETERADKPTNSSICNDAKQEAEPT